jgi:hypothetical protein
MSSSLSNVQAAYLHGTIWKWRWTRKWDAIVDSILTLRHDFTWPLTNPNYELWDQSNSGWMPLLLLKWKESMNLLVSQITDPIRCHYSILCGGVWMIYNSGHRCVYSATDEVLDSTWKPRNGYFRIPRAHHVIIYRLEFVVVTHFRRNI